ncbi:RagB/SusD family nutrient uptake outer membrane protein [Gelidibacter salicanalis]|uniref:RagB/SusD family nutrient uptake outer membrane protein n=1 Tax=Gelidibacter salicanalis TaxID=291193 RepID=A0A934KU95_9FLAO|nr:RagB/SusD family nutrient uptake outer membrane protein [Gelidibacter salicanalis]MBJ7882140.1 RagB/SusD family nutrient uptake outer membrane protein [Gelidibacter salicanalis]
MKKLIYLLGIVVIFSACDDSFLETAPDDALSPSTFWKSKKDLDLALTGCYSGFQSGDDIMYRDAGSDNAYNNFPWEGWTNIGNGKLSAADAGASYYGFGTINRCNEFLANVDKATAVSETDRAVYKAQVRFIRAYKYYVLTTNYGAVPLIQQNFATPEEAKVPRDSQDVIRTFIEDELTTVIGMLPDSYSGGEYGKATKGAAQALLMRYYLYFEDYDNALATAQSISGYSLHPSFEGLFDPANEQNEEIILSVQQTPDFYAVNFTPFMPNGLGGWSSVVPTQSLVDAFEMANGKTIQEAGEYDPNNPYINRDPRLRASIVYPGQVFANKVYSSIEDTSPDYYNKADNATKTGYNFKKYTTFLDLNPSSPYWNMGNDIYIFRYAEVLLTIAEAKIELSQIDNELYDAMDAVRLRAGMPAVDRVKYADQTSLRKLLRNERRVEFAMEGLRRDDIIRWGIATEVLNGDLMGTKRGTVLETTQPNGDHNVSLTLPSNLIENRQFQAPKNNLLPIPQGAIDKNPSLTPNNTGY